MDTWEELRLLGKRPVVAQIGGFRPSEDIKSWFGGNFLFNKNNKWANDSDGLMLPVLQIYVPEVPNGKAVFGDVELIQVFLNRNNLPNEFHAKNGNGWLLIEHKTIEGLELLKNPQEINMLKTFPIKWMLSENKDYPCWEEAWEYVDMTDINQSEELRERFFDELDSYPKTKIGGYAAYIQSPCSEDYNYIFQISSEEKPNFMVGDNGSIYILKSKKDNEWYLCWDCF